MTTFVTILMSILNLVMMNPNIPQETKDQIFSQTLTAIEQGFKQEAPVQAPVTVVEPVAFSAPVEPVFVAPVATSTATSTATTTQYVAGSVRTEGGRFIFNKGDSDLFRTKFTVIKGDDITEGKPNYIVSDIRGAKNSPQEDGVDLTTSEIEGTLWMYSSRNGKVLGERTYNFKVENGIAQLY